MYFKTNLTVLIIFAAFNLLMAHTGAEPAYTYLFLPYKIGVYMGMSKFMSALGVNSIMTIFVFVIPFLKQPVRYYYD